MPQSSRKTISSLSVIILIACGVFAVLQAQPDASEADAEVEIQPEKVAIIWTSGDPDVAHRMVLMYAHAAKNNGWFDEVRVVVWGPSARLLAGDSSLQEKLKEMQADGVILQACIVCADSYGVTEDLRDLGLEVKGMGGPLSEFIKDESIHVVTF